MPLSITSSCASSFAFASIKSAKRHMIRPRSAAVIVRQRPRSKAARAAATASSTSAAEPSAASAMTRRVAGSITSNVFPDLEARHSLSISSPGERFRKSSTRGKSW